MGLVPGTRWRYGLTNGRMNGLQERIQGLLTRVPGYDGYRSKENRRDEDKRVRDATADSLGSIVDQLTGKNAALVAERNLTHVSRLERLISQTRLLADRIRTATYGYGGIFTDRSVDDFALDQLRQFDVAFQSELASLGSTAAAMSSATPQPADDDFASFETELARLSTLFDGRTQVIDTARPTQDQRVLDLLNTAATPKPSPLSGIGLGETFSVLGDNFLTDAIVTLADGDLSLTLARVSGDRAGEGEWFMGSSDPEIGSARLNELPVGDRKMDRSRPVRVTVQSSKGAEDEVAGQYILMPGTDDAVDLAYSVGAEIRQFTGHAVNDMDIETFGTAKSQGGSSS